jgi:hypothetical protein
MMSTRSTTSRQSQPSVRYPKAESPPAPPEDSPAIPSAVISLPAGLSSQGLNPPQGKSTPPDSPTPFDEEAPASSVRRLTATPEEVLQAQVRELNHVLHEALNRLADADQRISQLEAESSRFRDNVLPEMECRIAATERLTLTRLVNQETPVAIPSGKSPGATVCEKNLPRESVDPKGRRGRRRSGKRGTNLPEIGEHSETSSNTEEDSSSSDELTPPLGLPVKGKAVAGLQEMIPARSDYAHLVSYRSYRLVNKSNRYDASVTGKLSSYLKRMKHAIPQEDRFSGDEPIEVLSFLRVFKEAADHNELTEAAAARLLPYFLTGMAKEGYRAHLDEAPLSLPTYPYMVQYLLETYAVDDELAQAYMAVTTAKQAGNEGEKAFGHRLHRLAIKAGNVIDKRDLTTIYVEGLPQFVQSGLRMHLTPGMSFETVQRLAHNLGVSLRQTIEQSTTQVPPKYPPGVKGVFPRGSAQTVHSAEVDESEEPHSSADSPSVTALEAALATIQAGSGHHSPSGSTRPSWKATASNSPSPSVVSIPTRGWVSPGGSVASEPPIRHRSTGPSRTGISKPVLCFLCYEAGHFLAECPRLPAVLQREATANREAYRQTREGARPRSTQEGGFSRSDSTPRSQVNWNTEASVAAINRDAVTATGDPFEEDPILENEAIPLDRPENESGGN